MKPVAEINMSGGALGYMAIRQGQMISQFPWWVQLPILAFEIWFIFLIVSGPRRQS
jgi:hypothetical protein